MKILLLGHKGYLGSFLNKTLDGCVDTIEGKPIILNNKEYDYVINCIGIPDLEYCEKHPGESIISNFAVVPFICGRYFKAKIINFSSYYVYDDEGHCKEDANVIYGYNYCLHNLLAEDFLIKNHPNSITFRLGKVFGNCHVRANKVTEYILENSKLFLDDVSFNPVSVNQISDVILYELEKHDLFGIFNLANLGTCTHYQYGKEIEKTLGIKKEITLTNKHHKFHNYGNFLMDISKISEYVKMRHWTEDMEEYLKEYRKRCFDEYFEYK